MLLLELKKIVYSINKPVQIYSFIMWENVDSLSIVLFTHIDITYKLRVCHYVYIHLYCNQYPGAVSTKVTTNK